MSDEELVAEKQWTPAAKAAYRSSGQALLSALRAHLELTIERADRSDEPQDYLASRERLEVATEAFNNAEYDWCGSFPLRVVEPMLSADDATGMSEDEGSDDESGQVLSVVTRQDYSIVDADAVIEAGRSSYLGLWTDDTTEDARRAVADVAGAAGEFAHANGWQALIGCPGLAGGPDAAVVVVHEGDGWWDDDTVDPYAIVYE